MARVGALLAVRARVGAAALSRAAVHHVRLRARSVGSVQGVRQAPRHESRERHYEYRARVTTHCIIVDGASNLRHRDRVLVRADVFADVDVVGTPRCRVLQAATGRSDHIALEALPGRRGHRIRECKQRATQNQRLHHRPVPPCLSLAPRRSVRCVDRLVRPHRSAGATQFFTMISASLISWFVLYTIFYTIDRDYASCLTIPRRMGLVLFPWHSDRERPRRIEMNERERAGLLKHTH